MPPAARGDLLRHAKIYPLLVFIDAVPQVHLCPTRGELRSASQYARIVGAAAAGATLTVDLALPSVRAVGLVAAWYRRRTIGEEWVTVEVNAMGCEARNVSLVDVRWLAERAVRRGILDAVAAARTLSQARTLDPLQRTWQRVLSFVPDEARPAMLEMSRHGGIQRLDAVFAVNTSLRVLARGGS